MPAPADVWTASSYGSPIYAKPGPVLASETVSSLMINVSGAPTGAIIPLFSGVGGEAELYDNAPIIPDNYKVFLYSVQCANANQGSSDGNCIQFHVISSGTAGSGIDFTVQANGNGGYELSLPLPLEWKGNDTPVVYARVIKNSVGGSASKRGNNWCAFQFVQVKDLVP